MPITHPRNQAICTVLLDSLGVQDLIPGVAVQGLLQALLVQGVAYEADGAGQNEQAVQVADGDDAAHLLLHIQEQQWRSNLTVLHPS